MYLSAYLKMKFYTTFVLLHAHKENIFLIKLINAVYPMNVCLQNSEYILKDSIQVKLHQEYFQLMLCFGTWKKDHRHVQFATLKW